MTKELLQQSFIKGSAPRNLDGFYRGKLNQFFPGNIGESLIGLIAKVWLPWYGKEFNNKKQTGNNLLPGYLLSLLKSRYGEKIFVGKIDNKINVFPFRTKITKGLKDNINVLQLNYNLAENPELVRNIIDELVQVGENNYLGKAYLKDDKGFRLVAFFSLGK